MGCDQFLTMDKLAHSWIMISHRLAGANVNPDVVHIPCRHTMLVAEIGSFTERSSYSIW